MRLSVVIYLLWHHTISSLQLNIEIWTLIIISLMVEILMWTKLILLKILYKNYFLQHRRFHRKENLRSSSRLCYMISLHILSTFVLQKEEKSRLLKETKLRWAVSICGLIDVCLCLVARMKKQGNDVYTNQEKKGV